MAKSKALEDTLAALGELRRRPTDPESVALLRQALQSKSSHVVAKAAQVAGELEIRELLPDLVAAFDRLLLNPVKSDPRCSGKTEIARALYQIGEDREDVLLRGIRYRQLEPVYGGKADTAIELRTVCAHGLVRINHRDVLVELADLLADPDPPARRGAARALAYRENEDGAPLLRLKILSGDTDDEVIADSLAALLRISPASVPFVARLLEDGPLRETAALALGGSRLAEAFGVLRDWWERTADVHLRRTGLVAVAMLRSDAAHGFLLELIARGNGPDARDAIAALATFRHDEALRTRVGAAVEVRRDIDLRAAFAKAFE